jgi:hypothetical protein
MGGSQQIFPFNFSNYFYGLTRNSPMMTMFVVQSVANKETGNYTEPSIGASYQILIKLAKWF